MTRVSPPARRRRERRFLALAFRDPGNGHTRRRFRGEEGRPASRGPGWSGDGEGRRAAVRAYRRGSLSSPSRQGTQSRALPRRSWSSRAPSRSAPGWLGVKSCSPPPTDQPVLTSLGRPSRADDAPPAPGAGFGTIVSVVTGNKLSGLVSAEATERHTYGTGIRRRGGRVSGPGSTARSRRRRSGPTAR
jgi:hypothetical protein